jgi:hypothetical protein
MRGIGLLVFAASGLAQTPSIVHILADESQVLVGRTLQMRAGGARRRRESDCQCAGNVERERAQDASISPGAW